MKRKIMIRFFQWFLVAGQFLRQSRNIVIRFFLLISHLCRTRTFVLHFFINNSIVRNFIHSTINDVILSTDFSRSAINFAFSQVISERSVNISKSDSWLAFIRLFSKFVGFKLSLIISLSLCWSRFNFSASIFVFKVSILSSFFENSFPISDLNVSFNPSFFCASSSVQSSMISSNLFLFFLDLASSDFLLDFLLDFVTPFFLSGFSKFSFCVIINEQEIEVSVNDEELSFGIFIGIIGSSFVIDFFSQDSTFSSTELTFLSKSSLFFISTSEILSALI
ncbi:hypothetical protein ALC62_14562 [Cyphomyrmex costatus]|uniref:Uncharacterized protein n=1 Tax=Cyphomyrmex costatus TaxID=456900 RepID=A0A195C2B4_9HYME|nr:hypothetical protein ALC62_14562 [Cyphomyrmex costatus]